jgi:DNA-binding response OmpR family regulator
MGWPMEKVDKRLSLLLVDDDRELCVLMTEFFSGLGHQLECVHQGQAGVAAALNGSYDLVILDIMLPVLDGFKVLEQLRRRNNVPVILLTARVQRPDRIRGLNSGADDYLPKPFDPDELLARIHAVLRRAKSSTETQTHLLRIGDVEINTTTCEVTTASSPVELTAMEFALLEILMRSAGSVVSRDEIALNILGRALTPYDRVLDVHISHLRKKLAASNTLIRTVRGAGYAFTATT